MDTMTDARPQLSDKQTSLLVVVDKRLVAERVCSFTLAAEDGSRLRDWTPGSHIDVLLPGGMTRQYSLCGDRWDAYTYRIAVLDDEGGRGGSAFLHDSVAAGDRLAVGGIRNNFRMSPGIRYRFLAGGIGITPLLPMLDQASRIGADWTLHYGGRTRRSMAFLDELERYGRRIVLTPEDEFGRIDLPGAVGCPDDETQIYACGPAPFLAAVTDACAQWRTRALHLERFSAAADRDRANTEFVVELARNGRQVRVAADSTVLDAVRQAGAKVLSSCEQGVCGTCEVAVLQGEPDPRDSILEPDSPEARQSMFVCVSRALSPRLVLDL